MRVARSSPPVTVDASPATPWVGEHAATLPDRMATVIYHSVVLPYFDSGERERFAAAVRAAGERARRSGPLAWISMEPRDDDPSAVELLCRTWPDGRSVRLARTTPHGTRVRWDPVDAPSR